MAKQMVNPVERHLEKVVLGIAALGLVYVIALYLITSPNKIELGGRMVTPGTIDAAVAERAGDIATRLRSAEPKSETPEPLFDDFAAKLATLAPQPLVAAAPFQPPVPIIDPPIDRTGRAKVVKVLTPDKPKVVSGRSTIAITQGGRQVFQPVNWATVSALFDYKKQVEVQKQAYGATQDKVIIFPPEIQRRKAHANGTWSDGDWEDVTPWPGPAVRVPEPPRLSLREGQGGNKVVPIEEVRSLEDFVKRIEDVANQREWIRPLMVPVVNGTKWAFPILTSYMDVRKQDDQYLKPHEAASSSPIDLYGLDTTVVVTTPTKPETPAQIIDAELKEIEAQIASARKHNSSEEAIQAHNKALTIRDGAETSAAQKSRAENLRKQAEQTERDIRRNLMIGTPGAAGGPGDTKAAVKRDPLPFQQLWAHDAAVDSLKDDATYQYRMRFRIYNQFAGSPEKLENAEDATKVIVAGDWSEASDPITFEPVSWFFVTYDDRSHQEIGVEFFRWYYGAWLKSRRAKIGIGDRLVTRHRTPARAIDNPDEVDEPEVEWTADGLVVDLDFSRKVQERKAGRGTGGVSFGQLRDDTATVLVKADGELEERFVSVDRDHPDKREVTSRLWAPKRAKP